ncbi:hypothetical protein KR200_002711, partial [Drosophila serrata]
MNIYLFLFVGLFFLSPILGQVLKNYTEKRYSRSVVNMDELHKLEEGLYLNLELYIAELIVKHETILQGISMMRELHHLELEQGPIKFWENPLNSYSLIRHMQSDWYMWQFYMEKPVGLEYLSNMEHLKPKMPQDHDFFDAAEGLRRMQSTYNLLATDISQGLLDGVQYKYVRVLFEEIYPLRKFNFSSSLTALDCFALAEHLINGSRWSIAQNWIEAASLDLESSNPPLAIELLRGITPALLYRTLGKIHLEEGNVNRALKAYQIAVSYSPQDAELWQEFINLEQINLILPESYPAKPEKMDPNEEIKLPSCCSGRCELAPHLHLYCFWNTETHPFLRLAPIKTELLSLDPHVILLHDVVSEAERNHLRSISKNNLLPSSTVDMDTGFKEINKYRTSKSVSYNASTTNVTQRLTVLLEDATGLDMRHSDPFEVNNYGVGGFFETHLDSLLDNKDRYNGTRDRMATTLFYLSEVQQGGGTTFPYLNLTVFPQPGSVLFWYNQDTRGNEDTYTSHAGCPVIVGSKWVMSKWIEDIGQEFRKPCFD